MSLSSSAAERLDNVDIVAGLQRMSEVENLFAIDEKSHMRAHLIDA